MKKYLWMFAFLIATGSIAGWLWHARQGSRVAEPSRRQTGPIVPAPPRGSMTANPTAAPSPARPVPATLSSPLPNSAPAAATPAVRSPRQLRERFAIKRVLHRAVVPLDAAGQLVERTDILELEGELPRIRLVEQLRIDPRTSAEFPLKATAMIADRVMVKLQPGLARADLAVRLQPLGVRLRQLGNAESVSLVEFPLAGGDPLPGVLGRLKAAADLVAVAEPDYIVTTQQISPNDPAFGDGALWSLKNTGQEGGVAGQDIHATEAWAITHDARNVIVAIVDTGARLTHVDLAENLWVNPGETGLDAQGRDRRTNGIDDDGDGFVDDVHGIRLNEFILGRARDGNPMDDNGHGTHVAGIIGAVGNNGKGITGVAWRVRLMPLKFLNDSGWGLFSDAIECIHYARRMGAHVCNNSWGAELGGSDVTLLRDALEQAGRAGMVIACAAGNAGSDSTVVPLMPANFDLPALLAVASLNRKGVLSDFSSFGGAHLAAPGEEIWSTFVRSDSDYTKLSGTSMASPHVAGAAALLRARYPNEPAAQIAQRIVAGATESALLSKPMLYRRTLNLARPLAEASLSRAPIITVAKRQFQSEQGPTLTLEASVASETPVTLQWRRNDTPIAGATAATLVLREVKIADSARYSLMATNANGTAHGWPILVEVFGPPSILQQPVATTVVETSDVQLSVYAAANGDPRLGFRWFFNGAALDVPSAATLQLREVAPASAGNYHVVVSNQYGQTTSATVRLTVTPAQAPAITRPPADLAITADADAVFSADVTGAPRPALQWRKDGADLPGAVESTLRIVRAQVGDAGRYTLVASNSRGRVTSALAQLTVAFAPVAPFFARQPVGRHARYGETVELIAMAKGSPPPTYQWRRSGAAIAGATAATYTIERARVEDAGDYSVEARNSTGAVVSDKAALTLASGPLLGGWSWRAPLPHGAVMTGMIFAEGRFIAVGRRGMIVTSPDGIVWTTRPTGVEHNLQCIAAIPGRIVVAGASGLVLTSSDGGLTWERGSMGADTDPLGMVAGNGRLLAYSSTHKAVFSSTDARTWTKAAQPARTDGKPGSITDFIFGNGHFLAAGGGGTIWRSADGTTWQQIRAADSQDFISVKLTYGAGLTIMSDDAGYVRTSVDEVEWTTRIQPGESGGMYGAFASTYVDGTYVLAIHGAVMISRDGVTWQRKATPDFAIAYTALAHGNGQWALCGTVGAISTSPDLTTWTRRAPEPVESLGAVAYGPAGFVAAGLQASRVSRDGILWSMHPLPAELRPAVRRLSVIDGRYVGVTDARRVATTSDGVNWTSSLVPEANTGLGNLTGIARGAGRYVLTGGKLRNPAAYAWDARLYTSTGLDTWTSVNLNGLDGQLNDVIFDGRRFVAVGARSTVLSSADGVAWAVESSDGTLLFNRIAFDGTTYVATTQNANEIHLSTDLKRWTAATLPKSPLDSAGFTALGFADLMFTAGQFIALYTDGRTLHSVDGRTWAESILPPANFMSGICAGNNTLVAVANDGSIFQSGPLRAALGSIALTPARQLVARGQPVRFELDTFGIDPGAQQWRKDGAELPGQSRAVFEIAAVEPSDVGAYDVRLRREGSEAKSQSAYLAVVDIPTRFDAAGGRGRIAVTAPPGFSWTIGTLAPWIKFDGEVVGIGSGGVDIRAEANTGELARSATFVFGGRTFVLAQAAPAATGRLANLSSRGSVQPNHGEGIIVGFVITGPQPKRVLLRGAGPALAGFGLPGTLGDPRLRLHDGAGGVLMENDNWSPDENDLRTWADQAGAFPFATGGRDAALLATLPAGSYTLQLTGTSATAGGLALAEIYELVGADEAVAGRRLVNLSTRGRVGAGDSALIGGFVIAGSSARRVLIRGVGPTLADFGVADALTDPELEVLSSTNATLARNDNWEADANAAETAAATLKTGAFALPAGSRDAAVLMTLAPGAYTVHVRGVGGVTGVGLFEVYEVPE